MGDSGLGATLTKPSAPHEGPRRGEPDLGKIARRTLPEIRQLTARIIQGGSRG